MLDLAGPGYISGEWMGPKNQLSPFDREDPKSLIEHWANLESIDAGGREKPGCEAELHAVHKAHPQRQAIAA